ncbi:hypothetical protein D3C76_1242080 [compost metagenome]
MTFSVGASPFDEEGCEGPAAPGLDTTTGLLLGHSDLITISDPPEYSIRSSVLLFIVRAAPALNTPVAIVMTKNIIKNWYWLLERPT